MKKKDLPFITEQELKKKCESGDHTFPMHPIFKAVGRVPYDCPNVFGKGTSLHCFYLYVPTLKCFGCGKTFEIKEPVIVREYVEDNYKAVVR